MTRLRLATAVMASVLVLDCETSDDRAHRQALDDLVQRSATRAEVERELGPGFTMHERGTQNWKDLESFLAREPPQKLSTLREAVTKYPAIMYYTTAWRMTWIFFDERGVIRDYYLTAQ